MSVINHLGSPCHLPCLVQSSDLNGWRSHMEQCDRLHTKLFSTLASLQQVLYHKKHCNGAVVFFFLKVHLPIPNKWIQLVSLVEQLGHIDFVSITDLFITLEAKLKLSSTHFQAGSRQAPPNNSYYNHYYLRPLSYKVAFCKQQAVILSCLASSPMLGCSCTTTWSTVSSLYHRPAFGFPLQN